MKITDCSICGCSWGYYDWSTIPKKDRECPVCKVIKETLSTKGLAYIPEVALKVLRAGSGL